MLKHQGRDPKVIWHEATRRWIMAVYSEFENKRWIAFHSSRNLKEWTFESRIEGFYECPDLFELPLDGSRTDTRWILYAADGNYVLGKFDGHRFVPDHPGTHRRGSGTISKLTVHTLKSVWPIAPIPAR